MLPVWNGYAYEDEGDYKRRQDSQKAQPSTAGNQEENDPCGLREQEAETNDCRELNEYHVSVLAMGALYYSLLHQRPARPCRRLA